MKSNTSRLRTILPHAPGVLAGVALVAIDLVSLDMAVVASAWLVASRLAYVLFVGISLRAEEKRGALSRRDGPDVAWARFRARAACLMLNDAVAIGALCIVTRGTMPPPGPPWVAVLAGLVLIVVGLGVKTWAAATLSEGSFYWRDFFVRPQKTVRSAQGPYRWLSNPMYTVGYAQTYGFALVFRSGPGLAGAAFAHVMILLLHALVERPHFRRLEAE